MVKWRKRHRATDLFARQDGRYRKRILEPHRDFIAERLAQNPHLTLHGLKAELAARGITVSHNTIWESLRSHGYASKKTLFALDMLVAMPPAEDSDGRPCSNTSIRPLVFIDETWIKTT